MKVLVVGCERSGTSVISSLIAKGCGISFLDDPRESWYYYPLIYQGFGDLSKKLQEEMSNHDIVKVPGFATILPYLDKEISNSFKIVFVVRDPRDVFASIKERLSQDINGLYLNVHWLDLRPKSIVESIAFRWRAYLDEAEKFSKYSDNLLFVKYEDFISDKLGTLNNIASFCELSLDSYLINSDLDKQFRKSWSKKIRGKKRYEKDLTSKEVKLIESICETGMKKYDYSRGSSGILRRF